jgi:hypothetical protein
MNTEPIFTVLVNSSDGFEDCWDPFFHLYQKHWAAAREPVLLNTELKDYQRSGMNISATRVQKASSRRLTWSECLLAALDQVQTPLVLYFQEDYFIDRPVLDAKVRMAASYMLSNPAVKHVALTGFGSGGPYLDHHEPWLQVIGQHAKYRIATQAALWRVETLKSYLVAEENGWMFEIYGTWRAHRRNDQFLVARHGESEGGPPIHYLHTGIIKGKWQHGIEEIFAANSISVDFERRGFYVPKGVLARRIETTMRLLERPGYFLRQAIGR